MAAVSKTLLRLIEEGPIEDMNILDVGCGSGGLTFALAPKVKSIRGMDIDKEKIDRAKERAKKLGLKNTKFCVGDAHEDYRALGIDAVVSNLFMADEVVFRAYGALKKGSFFAFSCFHSGHLKELGTRSRFSYTKEEMRDVLTTAGFKIEHLEVEKRTIEFRLAEDIPGYFSDRTRSRYKKDGRWSHLLSYVENEGRTLTESILISKARK